MTILALRNIVLFRIGVRNIRRRPARSALIVVGLIVSWEVVSDASSSANNADITFAVPWVNLPVLFAVVCAAALATTLLPAIRASRVYPAEALRYQ